MPDLRKIHATLERATASDWFALMVVAFAFVLLVYGGAILRGVCA